MPRLRSSGPAPREWNGVVCVGTDLASSQASIEVAALHDDVSPTVGLHPHDASKLATEWDDLVALAGYARGRRDR